jgi:large subunit ribosomal protein L30
MCALKKEETNNKKIKIVQIGSPIGRKHDQRRTLVGLGLNKMHKTSILDDNQSIRGMIKKVQHLIKIELVN